MGRSSVIVTITLIFGPSTLSTQNVGQLDIKNVENEYHITMSSGS